MAGKKKKKPAANPARGFATVSLPSKPKDSPDQGDEAVPRTQKREDADPDGPVAFAASAGQEAQALPAEKRVEHMTPEELELHLEQSELQHLVDSHAARVKSDAARHLAKLENERRQLRQLSERTAITGLTEQLMQDVLSSASPILNGVKVLDRAKGTTVTAAEDDLLLKLWTLREVLMQLQMPSIDDALTHALTTMRNGRISTADDYLPGLSDILMWYACTQDPTELPDYETGRVKAASASEGTLDGIDSGKSVQPDDDVQGQ